MKEIVFISQAFYPDTQATSQLFTDLLEHIVGDEVQVTVICGFPSERKDLEAHGRYENLAGVRIYRCGLNINMKRNHATRALSYASFLLHAAWRIYRFRHKDIIFGVTVPTFLVILLGGLAATTGLKYQYMLLDIYPEGLLGLGTLKPHSTLARVWMGLNRMGYHRAEVLPVLGRDMIPLLQKNYGLSRDKFVYIPHWSSVEVPEPQPFATNELARELGLQEKFVVQYSGNMGMWHDMESFVRAAERLRHQGNIHFLFIGKGARRQAAQELSESLNLRNITWLDFMPRSQLAQSLACCHVALISLRQGLEGVAVPSKLYGILASGRAIVAQVPRESEVAYAVTEEECGLVVEPDNVDQLVQALQRLAGDEAMVTSMGQRAFAAYKSKYTVEQAVAAFRKLWQLDRT